MKKFLAVLMTLCAASSLLAQSRTRYLISMRRPAAVSSLRLIRDAAESTAHSVRTFRNIDVVAADLTEAEVAALKKSGDVRYVSPLVVRSLSSIETSKLPVTGQARLAKVQTVPYGIDLVHAREVWPYTRGGAATTNVAIVDTGIDYTHPDLKDRYQGGYNAFTKTNDPKDDHGHGTHVAGIIGATDNSFGVVGVAPEVKIWSAKVLDSDGAGTDETVIAGIDWVISQKEKLGGNWIVNLSLGSNAPSDPEREMFARAIDDDILVVAAAGNTGARGLQYPAAYARVVAVSAINSESKFALFSSYGPGVAFAGPGVDVVSTFRTGVAKAAEIDAPAVLDSALPLSGSGLGEITADTVYCGIGQPEQFPADVKGKIALITRGTLYFRDKVKNAVAAGAVGAVIVPTVEDPQRYGWTLVVPGDDNVFKWPVTVSTSVKDGKALIDNAGKAPITIVYATDDYAPLSGTSMSTPHVVGTAALMWSLAPKASAEDIRLAMKMSADDLGPSGYDEVFGYGRIDALRTAKYVAPGLFGLPPTPPLVPTRRHPSSPHH